MLARTILYSAVARTPVTRSANSRFPTKNEGGKNLPVVEPEVSLTHKKVAGTGTILSVRCIPAMATRQQQTSNTSINNVECSF